MGYYILQIYELLLLTTLLKNGLGSDDLRLRIKEFGTTDTFLTTDDCTNSEIVIPFRSYIYDRDRESDIITATRCNATKEFVEVCQAKINCTVNHRDFRNQVASNAHCTNIADFDNTDFRYHCLPVSDAHSVEYINQTLTEGYLRSPHFPPAKESDVKKAYCRITPANSHSFQLQVLKTWASVDNGENDPPKLFFKGKFHGNISNDSVDEHNGQPTEYVDQDLTSLSLCYAQEPPTLRFLLQFKASQVVHIVCSSYNDTNPYEECEELAAKYDDHAKAKKGGSSDWWIWLIVGIVLVLLFVGAVFTGFFVKKRCFDNKSKRSSSKYQPTSTSGGDSPRSLQNNPQSANNNYELERPVHTTQMEEGNYSSADKLHSSAKALDPPYQDIGQPIPQPRTFGSRKPETSPYATSNTSEHTYAEPIPKSQRPGYAPPKTPRLASDSSDAPPKTPRLGSDSSDAPPKPKRLHQGIVSDTKKRLENKLPQLTNTGPAPTPGKRESEVRWGDPNPIYEQS